MLKNVVILLIPIVLSLTLMSCTHHEYEYYLTEDSTHEDVYIIDASADSDGACSFSVDGHEAEKYGEFGWIESEKLSDNNTYPMVSIFCTNAGRQRAPTFKDYFRVPKMFVYLYWPENISSEMLKDGIALEVHPASTLAPGENPAGVYLNIANPQTVKQPFFNICEGISLNSLRGTARVQTSSEGKTSLNVSALGYPNYC